MDPRAISLVKTTFKAVFAQADGPERLARSFYAILFANYPGTRDFFPAAMDAQRERLVGALLSIVAELEHMDRLLPYLGQVAREHRKYGVAEPHYIAVCDSLLGALRTFAGSELWTEDVDDAWTEALRLISRTMIAAAEAESRRTPAVWAGTVVAHQLALRDLAIIRVRLDQPMRYEPGQYVSVAIPSRPRMWRCLSPAAPQSPDHELEFHVRAVRGGWVSPAIVQRTRPGDQWLVGGPVGRLGRSADPRQDLLMIGCGTGIAPLRAQLLAMAQHPRNPLVHLFVCGHHPCDLYEYDNLRQLARACPWLTVTPVTESAADPWWHQPAPADPQRAQRPYTGPLGDIVAESGVWTDRRVQIAGSPAMVRATAARLVATGVPPEHIHHDPI